MIDYQSHMPFVGMKGLEIIFVKINNVCKSMPYDF